MISILLIIVGIGGLIFVHELGHFLTAKWFGVKVEVFSVGFGWKFLSWTWGETQYALSAIPLGGYVKMAGELPNEERTGAENELHSKSAGKRFWIFSAGSLMNLLVVFPICVLMFWLGVDRVENRIGVVRAGSPEWKAGVQFDRHLVGLRVQKTPGPVEDDSTEEWGPMKEVESLSTYRETLIGLAEGQHVKLFLSDEEGSGNVQSYVLDPVDPITGGQSVLPVQDVVRQVVDRSSAMSAGIRKGDRLVSINGQTIRSTRDIRQVIRRHVDPHVHYVVARADGSVDLHKLEVPQGTPYAMKIGEDLYPVYRPGEELDLRDELNLSDGDRIVQVKGSRRISPAGDSATMTYSGPLDVTNVSFLSAPSGPVSVRLERREDKKWVEKNVQLYPEIKKRPDPLMGLLMEPEISDVQSGSPADRAGLRSGDRVSKVNGHSVPSYYHLSLWLESHPERELELTVEREGKQKQVTVVPDRNAAGEGEIGVVISSGTPPAPLPVLPQRSGFAESGFREGDRVVAILPENGDRIDLTRGPSDGEQETGVMRFRNYATAHPEGFRVEVRRTVDGTDEVKKRTYVPQSQRSGVIGVQMQPRSFPKRYGFVDGIRGGVSRGLGLYVLNVLGIQKMFQSQEAVQEGLSGPVRIASFSYRAAEQGLGQFLELLAIISISLGILNLLPIPPLDGGHLLFLLIEVIRGKPLGEDVLYKIQLAGLLFFLGLFVLITYNDIINIMN